MPEIRQYTRQVAPRQMLNTQASPADFGAYGAQALQGLGQATDNLSRRVEEIQLRRDASEYERIMAEQRLDLMKTQAELQQSDFGDMDPSEAYDQTFQEKMDAVKELVPQNMRDRFESDRQDLRLKFVGAGIQDGIKRNAIKAQTNLDETMTAAENMIALNPDSLDMAIDSVRGQVAALPLSGEAKEAELSARVMGLKRAAAGVRINTTPRQFIQDALSGEYDDLDDLGKFMGAAKAQIDDDEREAEKQANEFQDRVIDRFEIAVLQGSASDAMLEEAKKLVDDPDEILRLEKIYRNRSEKSDPVALINYYQRIDAGEDVVTEIDNDDRLSVRDKIQLRKYNQSALKPEDIVSPIDAARRMFADAVPEQLLNNPEMAIKLAVARGEFEQEISNLSENELTYTNLRDIALKKIGSISSDYAKGLYMRAGVDVGQTKADKINLIKGQIQRIMENYDGDVEAMSRDSKLIKLRQELQALQAAGE